MTQDRNFSDDVIAKANAFIEDSWRDTFRKIRLAEDFEANIISQSQEISNFCASADTRSLAIIVISFLEDCLKSTFSAYWRISSKNDIESFFGSNGPVNSLDQRFLVAKAIGWITETTFKDASILRKIRNNFAHNHRVRSLLDDPVRSWAESLKDCEKGFCELPLEIADSPIFNDDHEYRLRMRVFCRSMMAVAELLGRSKLHSHGIAPEWRGGTEREWHLETDLRIFEACIRHCAASLQVKIE